MLWKKLLEFGNSSKEKENLEVKFSTSNFVFYFFKREIPRSEFFFLWRIPQGEELQGIIRGWSARNKLPALMRSLQPSLREIATISWRLTPRFLTDCQNMPLNWIKRWFHGPIQHSNNSNLLVSPPPPPPPPARYVVLCYLLQRSMHLSTLFNKSSHF